MQRAIQNREEYDVLIREMLHEMPLDICVNALCVEKSLTWVLLVYMINYLYNNVTSACVHFHWLLPVIC